jgi:hypothetical protein
MVALYAMKFPDHVRRAVQIGPMELRAGAKYPADLTGEDGTPGPIFAKLRELQNEPKVGQ